MEHIAYDLPLQHRVSPMWCLSCNGDGLVWTHIKPCPIKKINKLKRKKTLTCGCDCWSKEDAKRGTVPQKGECENIESKSEKKRESSGVTWEGHGATKTLCEKEVAD